jgi:hypothetical protein
MEICGFLNKKDFCKLMNSLSIKSDFCIKLFFTPQKDTLKSENIAIIPINMTVQNDHEKMEINFGWNQEDGHYAHIWIKQTPIKEE